MITIKNLREVVGKREFSEWEVRVDRASILGNPYYMAREEFRDKVCEQYAYLFKRILENYNICAIEVYGKRFSNDFQISFRAELERLVDIYKRYGKIDLYCWCAPKRCHAETIKHYLEGFRTLPNPVPAPTTRITWDVVVDYDPIGLYDDREGFDTLVYISTHDTYEEARALVDELNRKLGKECGMSAEYFVQKIVKKLN